MNKFILHGGQTRVDCDNNRNFYREMLNVDKPEINLLAVSFARTWDSYELPEKEVQKMRKLIPSKKLHIKIADTRDFENQLKWADSVYLRGGNGHLIREALLPFIDKLSQLFENKIVAGSSAGANVLARYYYDQDYEAIEEGLSILPIKSITHVGENSKYPTDYEARANELKNYKEDLELILLPETVFIIREA